MILLENTNSDDAVKIMNIFYKLYFFQYLIIISVRNRSNFESISADDSSSIIRGLILFP